MKRLAGNAFIALGFSTNDTFGGHLTLVACYQLAQSILKVGLFYQMGRIEIDGWAHS